MKDIKTILTFVGALILGFIIYWFIKKIFVLIIFGVSVLIAFFIIKNLTSSKSENNEE